jgi:hypothetical protein
MFNIAGTPSQTPAPAVASDSGGGATGTAAQPSTPAQHTQPGTPAQHTQPAHAPRGVSNTARPAELLKIRPGKAPSGEESLRQLLPLRKESELEIRGRWEDLHKEIKPLDSKALPGHGAPMDDLP